LHTYKLRLTNLSQGNRSLKLGKLSKRRDIDLKQLGHLHQLSAEQMLERIIAGKSLTLLNRPDARHEATNLADRRLNAIYREVQTIFEEMGTYDLFLGYPFAEGKFINGTIARCPVLLFPVKLVRNLSARPRWKLSYLSEEPVSFNRTFFLAYEQFQQVRLPEAFWEEEIEPQSYFQTWLNQLYETIKRYEIEVNFNSGLFEQQLNSFPDYLKVTLEKFRVGQLKFQPHAVLGIFPQSDSALLQDYEVLEQTSAKLTDTFFVKDPANLTKSSTSPYIKEEHRYFVTAVDQTQEAALLAVKNGQSIVLHGPPGTGKSQVIVNLMADALAHGKKVLLVSQKRAALDVVYNRLEAMGLGRFAVLLHDYRHDRKPIYEQIRKQIDDIDLFRREINDLNITQWEYNYQLISREIDRFTRKYDELYEALTKPLACGYNPHYLYTHTDPEPKLLPLQDLVDDWTQAELMRFMDRIQLLFAYKDFLQPGYPWVERLPFHFFTQEDFIRISTYLARIPQQLAALHHLHKPLYQSLKGDLLDTSYNMRCVEDYQKIAHHVTDPQIRLGLQAIQEDERRYETLISQLQTFEERITVLDQLHILDDSHWRIYGSLRKHLENYHRLKEQFTKWVSIPYLSARWFIRKILKAKDLDLSEVHIDILDKDFSRFTQLHTLYAEAHEYAFTGDFPLLNTQPEKKAWLQQKYDQLEVYHFIDQLTYFPGLPRLLDYPLQSTTWRDTFALTEQLAHFSLETQQVYQEWQTYLHSAQITKIYSAITQPSLVSAFTQKLFDSFKKDFRDLQELDRLLEDGVHKEKDALAALTSLWESYDEVDSLQHDIQQTFYYHWLLHGERLRPVLGEVSTRSWDQQAAQYSQKVAESRSRVVELITRKIKERIMGIIEYNRLNNPVTYRNIYHQVTKKRRIWSVRKLIQQTWDEGLKTLLPAWMTSPESAAAIFPMQEDFFDLVIFDEASQCFVEKALPIVVRGKQVVIAGDDQQLQPLDLYQVRYDEAESAFVENEMALEVESILDLAKTTLPEVKLSWHYRSQQAALINFSNYHFYKGRLQVMPTSQDLTRFQPALEWIQVEGTWQHNRNIEEAYEVIRVILSLITQPNPPSIGVVTFNYHQQELIKDLLEAELVSLLETDPQLYRLLQAALQRTDLGDFQGLFIKNIENVQGDERDVIIFSVGYGYNEKGKLSTHFGLLSQVGGEHRLNVAISRARYKVYVICSFHPDQLEVSAARNSGPILFKAYLQYVKAISEDRVADAQFLLPQQVAEKMTYVQNPISVYIESALTQRGYSVEQNVGDTGFKLDLAIKSALDPQRYLLGIACEGSYYFSGASSKEREIYRLDLLRSKGWRLYRVWARNFWLDREGEVNKIIALLEDGGKQNI